MTLFILFGGVSLLVAAMAVWAYRKLTAMKGVNFSLVSLSDSTRSMKVSQQQGYVKLDRYGGAMGMRRPRGKVKKPWGW